MKSIEKTTLLNNSELKYISGGSGLTDKFWNAVGWSLGYSASLWEIWTADPNNSRFR